MKAPLVLLFTLTTLIAQAAEQWGVYELTLAGPASGNPYVDVQWSATFTQGDSRITVPGFWDGGDTYRIRFSPPTTGQWHYRTRSAAPELNGKTGAFTVTPHKADVAFRFTPYAVGEPLRPEARIEATPTEGTPPMAVAFQAITDAAQAEWDFGDDATATGREVKARRIESPQHRVAFTMNTFLRVSSAVPVLLALVLSTKP